MKIKKVLAGVMVFGAVFFGSIAIRDALYERHIQINAKLIKVGMTQAEVIKILGDPTSQWMTDGPGSTWCYGSSSWMGEADSYCGSISFQMGYRVESTPQ